MIFNEAVNELTDKYGWSNVELAKKFGVCEKTITRWKKSEVPVNRNRYEAVMGLWRQQREYHAK